MDGRNFYDYVKGHEELEWLGVREGQDPSGDEVLIRDRKMDSKFAVSISAIQNNTWEELQSVLTGSRAPQIMMHVTRIVGYYSQLQNWNRSKIAELHDRHKGDYSVPERPVAHMASPASTEVAAVA